jgi:AbrB family looped-hinge helix DNA binding protein
LRLDYTRHVRKVRRSVRGGGAAMELAKITSKGQITIPVAIRKALGVKDGDKVLFIQEGDKVIIMNASLNALLEAQRDFQGVADELGVRDEQDVVDMVKKIRKERSGKYLCE